MKRRTSGERKNRREFLREGLTTAAAFGLSGALLQCDGSRQVSSALDGSLDGGEAGGSVLDRGSADAGVGEGGVADLGPSTGGPLTTVRQRIVGELPVGVQPAATKNQWGITRLVAGEPHLRRDLLFVDTVAGKASGPPTSLFYAAQLSDVHIVDEESPARALNLDGLIAPAWRAQEAHTSHVLDAMVRKLHELNASRALDCVIFSGDCIDSNQANELAWFLGVLQGGQVMPNSGAREDPRTGPDNDPHDSFVALGMGNIPWYVAMGNHDVLVQGNLRWGLLGSYAVLTGDPTRGSVAITDLGRVNDPKCLPIPADEAPLPDRCIPMPLAQLKNGGLTADKARAHLTRQAWIENVRAAKGLPAGHGLSAANAASEVGDYVADPVAGLPLRLVVLDTTALVGALGSYGRIDSFLKPALQKAQADNVLVIVASHHPSASMPLDGGSLRAALLACPNVILHLVGHGHANQVLAHRGSAAGQGYWEVQTCSLIDWPQQARLLELVDKRDGTAELWLTMFNYGTVHRPLGALAQAARFLSLYDVQSGGDAGGKAREGVAEDRNVILPVALPAAVRAKLAALPGQPLESQRF